MLSLLAIVLIVMMICGLIGNGVELAQFGPRRVAAVRVVGFGLALVGCAVVAFRVIAVGL